MQQASQMYSGGLHGAVWEFRMRRSVKNPLTFRYPLRMNRHFPGHTEDTRTGITGAQLFNRRKTIMRVEIDQTGCISCGLCVNTCPELFSMGSNEKAEVTLSPVPASLEECARKAADTCPVSVIEITS